MPSRRTVFVLILLGFVAIVAVRNSPYGNMPTVPQGPVAMAAAPKEASPSLPALAVLQPPPPPADGAAIPAETPPALRTGAPSDATSPPVATSESAPTLPGPDANTSKANETKDRVQAIVYAVADGSAETAMKILKIAAPEAQFTAGEDNKSLVIATTPANHERIRALLVELRGHVTHTPPRDARAPTYGVVPTKDPMLVDSGPFGAAPAAADPFGAPPAAADPSGGNPFDTTPSGPAGLPWTDPAGKVTRTAVLDTGGLSAETVKRILEAEAPEAEFTVDPDDDKSLTVSAPPDEFEKVEDALRNLPKGMSDLRVVAVMSMAASDAARRSARLRGRPSGPTSPYYESTPAAYGQSFPSTYHSTPYSSPFRKPEPADPEMAKMEQSDANAGKKVAEIVNQFRTAAGEEQQAEARKKLRQAVLEHFAVRQAKRELEVTRLEARLEKVRQSIAKRSELEDQIVDRRISQLLGEEDDLEF